MIKATFNITEITRNCDQNSLHHCFVCGIYGALMGFVPYYGGFYSQTFWNPLSARSQNTIFQYDLHALRKVMCCKNSSQGNGQPTKNLCP